MANISIEITNIREIRSAFRKSPQNMTKELNNAIKESIHTIERDSKLNTPVDTGRLRSSTYTRFSTLKGEVGTNTNYDVYVHEGTRYRKGRPYLRRAVESNSSEINRFFTQAVQNVLNKIGQEIK